MTIDGSSYNSCNKDHFDPMLVWLIDLIGYTHISIMTVRLNAYGYSCKAWL